MLIQPRTSLLTFLGRGLDCTDWGQEVLQSGSFGGGYFRPIYSAVLKQDCKGVWKELPAGWIEGLDVEKHLASETYRTAVNKYKVMRRSPRTASQPAVPSALAL